MTTMRHRTRRRPASLHKLYAGLLVAVIGTGAVALTSPAVLAQEQQPCRQPPEPAEVVPEVPWAQDWFGPDRVWPLSRGRGVTVAVVDSGVDAGHPQLRQGQVLTGTDLLEEPVGGQVDCDSHGTAVASIIAGAPLDGVGFAGLAPAARILPVRVAERAQQPSDPDQEPPVTPGTFAEAVRWATDQGADIINVSIVFYRDHEVVADAVAYAAARDVLVVAAVGNLAAEADDDAGLTPYPAAYPEVIGVGPIDASGAVPPGAYTGPYLDLVAPGIAVTAAAAVAGHHAWSGSSFAAPFVTAAAALVRAADPDLSAAGVARRLRATADPPPGSREVAGLGVVNPYRALTERVGGGDPVAAQPPGEPVVDPAAQARSSRWERMGELARYVLTGAVVVVVVAGLAAAVWRRGRRWGWRPVRRPDPPDPAPAQADPEDDPQRRFFRIPTPRDR